MYYIITNRRLNNRFLYLYNYLTQLVYLFYLDRRHYLRSRNNFFLSKELALKNAYLLYYKYYKLNERNRDFHPSFYSKRNKVLKTLKYISFSL